MLRTTNVMCHRQTRSVLYLLYSLVAAQLMLHCKVVVSGETHMLVADPAVSSGCRPGCRMEAVLGLLQVLQRVLN